MALEDLYKEVILDHYKNPRNKRPMPDAELTCSRNNPLCGDEIQVFAHVENGTVADVAFQGQGCSISQSSASMLTEAMKGKQVGDAEKLAADFRGSTDQLAIRSGPRMGGLMNATFGNVTELIISIFLIVDGQIDIVKASLIGSIIGNLLIVLGLSLFVGGLRQKEQHFSAQAAG